MEGEGKGGKGERLQEEEETITKRKQQTVMREAFEQPLTKRGCDKEDVLKEKDVCKQQRARKPHRGRMALYMTLEVCANQNPL